MPPDVDTARSATREQLLAAAAEVFDEAGFRRATIREICHRAQANVAAINYHFGDKETLYAEVLKQALRTAREKYPPTLGLGARAKPAQRLRAFVHSFLLRVFDQEPQAFQSRLMLRELVDPTAALDTVVREEVRPMARRLIEIVSALLGPKASPEQVRLCSMSVVSQAMFYHHCRAVIVRLFPDLKFDLPHIETLTEHITSFSLAALRNAARKPKVA